MNFIVGCGRSGTTAVAKLLKLDKSNNVHIEKTPYLSEESWLLNQDISLNKKEAVLNFLNGDEERAKNIDNDKYFEKQLSIGPFIKEIHSLTNAKFIYVYRDGRDVVSSFLNWHKYMFGNIYRYAKPEQRNLPKDILEKVISLNVNKDLNSKYMIPLKPYKFNNVFSNISRFELLCQHWSLTNKQYLDSFSLIPDENCFYLNINNLNMRKIIKLFNFIKSPLPPESTINNFLDKRINSLEERSGKRDTSNKWFNWCQKKRGIFESHATAIMRKLEYWDNKDHYWKPPSFGNLLKEKEKENTNAFYKSAYEYRLNANKRIIEFVNEKNSKSNNVRLINSLIDLGCGTGHGFTDAFFDIQYTGFDMSRTAIEYANLISKKNNKTNHLFYCQDFLFEPIKQKADIAFSSATIDNVYDINLFLERLVNCAKKYIYFNSHSGWFLEYENHKYNYVENRGYFNNNISQISIKKKLEELGCKNININPIWTGKDEIPVETEFYAEV